MNIIEKKIKHNILLDDDDTTNNVTEVANTDISSKLEAKPELKTNTKLFYHILKRGPSCGLIVVDNFYSNAMNTRNYILTQDFSVKGNFPGNRTVSYATENLKEIIQK